MASHSQQGRARKPLVPTDHGNFKQLLLTIKASRQCFCREEQRRAAPGSLGSSNPRKQRADPPRELPKRLPSTQDCRLGLQCGLPRKQRTADLFPYLFLSHGIDVLTVRAQHQVSQDGAAFMGHNILVLQSLVLPLSCQVHEDLWGEQGAMSIFPHTPQSPPKMWDTECAPLGNSTPPSYINMATPQPLQHSKVSAALQASQPFPEDQTARPPSLYYICLVHFITFMLMPFISPQGGRTHPWLSHCTPLCAAAQPQSPSR